MVVSPVHIMSPSFTPPLLLFFVVAALNSSRDCKSQPRHLARKLQRAVLRAALGLLAGSGAGGGIPGRY